ncbi:MAG: phage/plasmid replication protein [Flavobacteriia bacterium]|jgi:hypothetical protein
MIDTVRIDVLFSQNSTFYDFCLKNSKNCRSGFIENYRTGIHESTTLFTFKAVEYENKVVQHISGDVLNKSSSYKATYLIKEYKIIFEFSIPKFVFGTNAIQSVFHFDENRLTPYEYLKFGVNYFFRNLLKNELDIFYNLDWSGIHLRRVDFCFNQYFQNYNESIKALDSIKLKVSKRYTNKEYDTSIISISERNYQKVYHKGEEFLKNDLKKIEKMPIFNRVDSRGKTLIERLTDLSSSCLRYEKQYKPSNWSYLYLKDFSNKGRTYYKRLKDIDKQIKLNEMYKIISPNELLRQKKEIEKFFDSARISFVFELSEHMVKDYRQVALLTSNFFNFMYHEFLNDIKKRYNIMNNSISALNKFIVDKKHDKKNKSTEHRILLIIKNYGSLEMAYKKGMIAERTFFRYKKYLHENNLSTTNIKINIKQDWTYETYFKKLNENNIIVNNNWCNYIN